MIVCMQKEANWLVEEFMLLANMTTARMVAEAWPDRCAAARAAAALAPAAQHTPGRVRAGVLVGAPAACHPLRGATAERRPPSVESARPPPPPCSHCSAATHLTSVFLSFPCRALLRCHPPPNMHKMVELSATAAELGFELDTSGAGGWPGRLLFMERVVHIGNVGRLRSGL